MSPGTCALRRIRRGRVALLVTGPAISAG
jgi:hypothetical protein